MSVQISIPIHGNKPLKIGLLKHFMKIAGVKKMNYKTYNLTAYCCGGRQVGLDVGGLLWIS